MPKGQAPLPRTIEKKVPRWLARALNPKTPTTKDTETVRTSHRPLGKDRDVVFPTIRMVNGKLKKMSEDEAYETALKKKDFIVTKDGLAMSKRISRRIAKSRNLK